IHLTDPGDGSADVVLTRPNGRGDRYAHNPDGSYGPPAGVATALVKNGDATWTATLKDQTRWSFDAQGRLTAVADRYGNQAALTYDASGRLSAIADPAGRGSLSLTYDNY